MDREIVILVGYLVEDRVFDQVIELLADLKRMAEVAFAGNDGDRLFYRLDRFGGSDR